MLPLLACDHQSLSIWPPVLTCSSRGLVTDCISPPPSAFSHIFLSVSLCFHLTQRMGHKSSPLLRGIPSCLAMASDMGFLCEFRYTYCLLLLRGVLRLLHTCEDKSTPAFSPSPIQPGGEPWAHFWSHLVRWSLDSGNCTPPQ